MVHCQSDTTQDILNSACCSVMRPFDWRPLHGDQQEPRRDTLCDTFFQCLNVAGRNNFAIESETTTQLLQSSSPDAAGKSIGQIRQSWGLSMVWTFLILSSQLSIQEWNKASDRAEAYAIGERESGAALNLLKHVDATTVSSLSSMAQTLGPNNWYLLHVLQSYHISFHMPWCLTPIICPLLKEVHHAQVRDPWANQGWLVQLRVHVRLWEFHRLGTGIEEFIRGAQAALHKNGKRFHSTPREQAQSAQSSINRSPVARIVRIICFDKLAFDVTIPRGNQSIMLGHLLMLSHPSFQELLQRQCAAFQACIQQFKANYPDTFTQQEIPDLEKAFLRLEKCWTFLGESFHCNNHIHHMFIQDSWPRFFAKHADAELMVMLETSVPPADISRIGIFRTPVAKHGKQAGWKLVDTACYATFMHIEELFTTRTRHQHDNLPWWGTREADQGCWPATWIFLHL